jgi:hypothetical protein
MSMSDSGPDLPHVIVESTPDGLRIDPAPYLAALDSLHEQLPRGAWELVAAAGHYGFGDRCPYGMLVEPRQAQTGSVVLRGNPFKHDEDLNIRYQGVRSVALFFPDGTVMSASAADALAEPHRYRLGDDLIVTQPNWEVAIDEVLPIEGGCAHKIMCREGTIVIECADLTHSWIPMAAVTGDGSCVTLS